MRGREYMQVVSMEVDSACVEDGKVGERNGFHVVVL